MAEFTQNYNLKKPAEEDFYNIKDFNDNADIIDQALKAHDDALATKETPSGAQAKANAAEQNAKDYAENVANQAETNAKNYADTIVGAVEDDLASHKNESAPHQYGGRFEWRYNPNANSLDLVVIE